MWQLVLCLIFCFFDVCIEGCQYTKILPNSKKKKKNYKNSVEIISYEGIWGEGGGEGVEL